MNFFVFSRKTHYYVLSVHNCTNIDELRFLPRIYIRNIYKRDIYIAMQKDALTTKKDAYPPNITFFSSRFLKKTSLILL